MNESARKLVSEDIKLIRSDAWRKVLLPADATLQQAIHNLDESALQIVMVVSTEGTLLGTITDGDIRRGLIRGLNLNNPLTSIVRRDPVVVPPEINRDVVLQLMQANVFNAIPVVNAARHVLESRLD